MRNHWSMNMALPTPTNEVPEGFFAIPTLGALIEAMNLNYRRTHDGADPFYDVEYTKGCIAMAEMVEDGWVSMIFNPATSALRVEVSEEQMREGLAAMMPEVMAEMGCAVSATAEA